jgi:hypothetical protein
MSRREASDSQMPLPIPPRTLDSRSRISNIGLLNEKHAVKHIFLLCPLKGILRQGNLRRFVS